MTAIHHSNSILKKGMELQVFVNIWERRVIDSGQANEISIEGTGREYEKHL